MKEKINDLDRNRGTAEFIVLDGGDNKVMKVRIVSVALKYYASVMKTKQVTTGRHLIRTSKYTSTPSLSRYSPVCTGLFSRTSTKGFASRFFCNA